MSVAFCSRRFPSRSTPNINEALSRDVTASLHRNVMSWDVWRGHEKKDTVFLKAITQSGYSQTEHSGSCCGVSNLLRTASVPDVVGRNPKTAFPSITITAREVLPSLSTSNNTVFNSSTQHVMLITPPKLTETFWKTTLSIPTSTMRISNCQPDVCSWNPTTVTPNEFRQAYSPADGLELSNAGMRKVQPVQYRVSYTEGNRNQDALMNPSSQPSYRSCIHREVSVRSNSSVVFLDKSLSISLVELEGRKAGQPSLYRSTMSVYFGVSSRCRSSTDNKDYRRPRAVMLSSNKCNGQESGKGHCRGPLIKQQCEKVAQVAPALGGDNKADDSDTQRHSTTLGLLSFSGSSPSNTKTGMQKGNADEGAFQTLSNFRDRQHNLNMNPASRTWSKQAVRDKNKEQQEHPQSTESQKVSALDKTYFNHFQIKDNSLDGTPKTLSLKEALELFRPDFISKSQGRLKRLEQRARRRRALQDSNPDLVQGFREDRGKQRKNCTTPDPLSDNLFKPRERSISGREMQLRSRRIYNKLPEVTKKKEEEEKKAVSQTNRLRAEVFKKRLLDQILQR
ncbi:(E2-independent) E3 ubiquitin-conjugating enzyme FATS isoform X2 [Mastacembelus armatus]|uniref:(E2-independent) E3 ubiquitin-conjugating enzyme FATS isoform X2 n=1 Tax=Mastacembelus armatus TaxID=205130 RepID=UPI000E45FA95|nr:(E2-independent) E3 ubiquitin-conjugating enzyme FATS-like isoform X2 [Mastacembelus armatus]